MRLLFEGIVLGLSLGVTCVATCAPVYAPVLMQREHSAIGAVGAVLLMSLGRFLSYAAVGLAAGATGAIAAESFRLATATAVSYFAIAMFLIYSALVRNHAERHGGCSAGLIEKTAGNPFLAGIVTGFSVCPPFLGALTRGFDAGGALGGMTLFTGFFLGTTAYFLPLALLPLIAHRRIVRLVGIFSSFVAALWFTLLGIDHFFDLRFKVEMCFEDAYLVDYAQTNLVMLDTSANTTKGRYLASLLPNADYHAVRPQEIHSVLRRTPPYTAILLLTDTPPDDTVRAIAVEQRINVVWTFAPQNTKDAEEIRDFLSSYVLKARKKRGFLFQIPLPPPDQ